jgi:hypothetical protein
MVLATSKIGDFDQFWSVFSTKGAEKRKEYGSRGSTVYRNTNDPGTVYVLMDIDEEDFKKFVSDPGMPAIFEEGGLKAPPEPVFVEEAGKLDS